MRNFGSLDGQKEITNNDHSWLRRVFIYCGRLRLFAFNIVTLDHRYFLDTHRLPKFKCIPHSRRHQNRTLGIDWRGKYFFLCCKKKRAQLFSRSAFWAAGFRIAKILKFFPFFPSQGCLVKKEKKNRKTKSNLNNIIRNVRKIFLIFFLHKIHSKNYIF